MQVGCKIHFKHPDENDKANLNAGPGNQGLAFVPQGKLMWQVNMLATPETSKCNNIVWNAKYILDMFRLVKRHTHDC